MHGLHDLSIALAYIVIAISPAVAALNPFRGKHKL